MASFIEVSLSLIRTLTLLSSSPRLNGSFYCVSGFNKPLMVSASVSVLTIGCSREAVAD